jgi:hypothetical protein
MQILQHIPEDIRQRTHDVLRDRARRRRAQLSHEEDQVRQNARLSPLQQSSLPAALAELRLRHFENEIDDHVNAWMPLIEKIGPEAVQRFKDQLLEDANTEPSIPPDIIDILARQN